MCWKRILHSYKTVKTVTVFVFIKILEEFVVKWFKGYECNIVASCRKCFTNVFSIQTNTATVHSVKEVWSRFMDGIKHRRKITPAPTIGLLPRSSVIMVVGGTSVPWIEQASVRANQFNYKKRQYRFVLLMRSIIRLHSEIGALTWILNLCFIPMHMLWIRLWLRDHIFP